MRRRGNRKKKRFNPWILRTPGTPAIPGGRDFGDPWAEIRVNPGVLVLPPGPRGLAGFRAPPLPTLTSLFEPASWVNNGGHVDRSACLDLSATEALVIMRAAERAASNGQGRRTTGVGTVRAENLEYLHATRRPRRVLGDYRWKCHLMYGEQIWSGGARPQGLRTASDGPEHRLMANPNQGASCEKVLGLGRQWRQALRVERWGAPPATLKRATHAATAMQRAWPGRMAEPFLVCPGRERLQRGADVSEPPPVSRRGRTLVRHKSPTPGPCQERVRKLYLPLCRKQEWADAQAAQEWLERVGKLRAARRVEAAGSELEALLVERYGQLFAPRALLCAQCLGRAWGKINAVQMAPHVRKWFGQGRAPELPDPFARNRLGRPFAHDQLHHPLPKSALKNEKTRAAALAEMGLNIYGEPIGEHEEDAELLNDPLIDRLAREEQELQKALAAESKRVALAKRKEKARAVREEKFRKQCAGLADWEIWLLKMGLVKRDVVEPPAGDLRVPGVPELAALVRRKRMLTALEELVKKTGG